MMTVWCATSTPYLPSNFRDLSHIFTVSSAAPILQRHVPALLLRKQVRSLATILSS